MSEESCPSLTPAQPPGSGPLRIVLAAGVILLLAVSPWLFLAGYLELFGIATDGAVIERHEAVMIRGDHWQRELCVVFNYRVRDSAEILTASQAVSPTLYERVRVGTPVRVLYSAWSPLREWGSAGATLAQVSWYDRLPRESDTVRLVLEIQLCGATAVLGYLAYRRRSRALCLLALTFATWVGAGLLLYGFLLFPLLLLLAWRRPGQGFGWVLLTAMAGSAGILAARVPWPAKPVPGSPMRAEAVVRQVHEVSSVWHASRVGASGGIVYLKQPFQIVDLEFEPAGWHESVHAVDTVDLGSVPPLVPGERVTVSYPDTQPHAARIEAATRDYGWRLYKDVMVMTYGAAVVVLLVGWPIVRLLRKLNGISLPTPGALQATIEQLPEGDPRRHELEERIRALQLGQSRGPSTPPQS